MSEPLGPLHARRERLLLERIEASLRRRLEDQRAAPLIDAAARRALTPAERRLLDGALARRARQERRLVDIDQEVVELNDRIARLTLRARTRREP